MVACLRVVFSQGFGSILGLTPVPLVGLSLLQLKLLPRGPSEALWPLDRTGDDGFVPQRGISAPASQVLSQSALGICAKGFTNKA